MKICIVSQIFAPQEEGGAEISSRQTATNLARHHEVVVLALGLAGHAGAEPGEVATEAPYRLHRVSFKNSYLPAAKRPSVSFLEKALWHGRNAIGAIDEPALEHFFKTECFDLIYAQNCTRMLPALYNVAAKLGIPVCQHLRDYALLCPRASMYRAGHNCAQQCSTCSLLTFRARRASATVGTVIAVSDFVRRRFLDHGLFPAAKWHVLHNTNTSTTEFDPALRMTRPQPEPGFVIGYLGALSEEKGVEVLLRAFCALPQSLGAKLLLAGRGHQDFIDRMQLMAQKAGASDRIEWLGHVPPETVFSRSEVIVVPSLWHEPQGRVLIEAAIYKVPVIAAKSGGIPEIVEQSATGWTYDAANVDALIAMLQTAAENGAAAWRASLRDLFPGLASFSGTAEDSKFYERLEEILLAAHGHRDVREQ